MCLFTFYLSFHIYFQISNLISLSRSVLLFRLCSSVISCCFLLSCWLFLQLVSYPLSFISVLLLFLKLKYVFFAADEERPSSFERPNAFKSSHGATRRLFISYCFIPNDAFLDFTTQFF